MDKLYYNIDLSTVNVVVYFLSQKSKNWLQIGGPQLKEKSASSLIGVIFQELLS